MWQDQKENKTEEIKEERLCKREERNVKKKKGEVMRRQVSIREGFFF